MKPAKKPTGRRAILWEEPPANAEIVDRYLYLGRQMEVARPREVAALYMMRSKDKSQQEAMQLIQEARTAMWTRRAVFAAVLSVPLNGFVTFLVTRS